MNIFDQHVKEKMESERKIVLFDGVCNLCDRSVQLIIKHDEKDEFRFAALQGDIGNSLVQDRNIDTSQIDSIILIEPGVAYYTKSDAALQIGMHLKGFRTISKLLYLIPSNLRNIVYDIVAHNRYKWYGKKDACLVPTSEMKVKFLDN